MRNSDANRASQYRAAFGRNAAQDSLSLLEQPNRTKGNNDVFQFSPSLDVLYTRSEYLRRVRDEDKRISRDAQLRRELAEVVPRDARRKKLGWRRPFYPAGA